MSEKKKTSEELRERMVQEQLIQRGIREERILNVFRKVPRHLFLPSRLHSHAYEDHPLEIGFDQTISQPYIVALMVECLRLKGQEKVLEVGTGSGYQTALLAELASSVFTIERIPSLASEAKGRLEAFGYHHVFFKIGDGSLGWPQAAPFDGMLVSCAAKEPPQPLLSQLKEGGVLVIPLGGALKQTVTVVQKKGEGWISQEVCPCLFVPLIQGKPL